MGVMHIAIIFVIVGYVTPHLVAVVDDDFDAHAFIVAANGCYHTEEENYHNCFLSQSDNEFHFIVR